MRIYIIGFMGSGKSGFGKKLAHKLSYNFLDLDTLIEEKADQTASDIFLKSGEEYFRKLEHSVLKETFKIEHYVISTGGGTPAFFDNMKQINKYGFSIFLKLNSSILYDRLVNSKKERPLMKNIEKKDLKEYIKEINQVRLNYYKMADLIISPLHFTPELTIKYLP